MADSGPVWAAGLSAFGVSGLLSGLLTYKLALRREAVEARRARDDERDALIDALAELNSPPGKYIKAAREAVVTLVSSALGDRVPIDYRHRTQFFSVAYDLHAPVVLARIIKKAKAPRKTLFAEGKGAELRRLWTIGTAFEEALMSDEKIAASDPSLAYYPDQKFPASTGRLEQRAIYRRQNLNPSILMPVLMTQSGGIIHKNDLFKLAERNELTDALAPSRRALSGFTPRTSPIFWRILLILELLCDAFEASNNGETFRIEAWPSEKMRAKLNWSLTPSTKEDPALAAVREYARAELLEGVL